jgi:hypothetical protein
MEECRCRKKICSWNRTFILTELASWLDVYPVWTFIRTGRLSCLDVHSTRTFILTERSSEPDVYPATRVYKLSCSFRVSRPPGGGLPFDWNGARKPSRILPLRVERSHAGWCSADPVQNVNELLMFYLSFTCYKYNISTIGFANKIARFYKQLLNNFLTCFWRFFNSFSMDYQQGSQQLVMHDLYPASGIRITEALPKVRYECYPSKVCEIY